MNSIGTRLRQERLQKGLSLAELADDIKIKRHFLEAIEAGNFDQLPGKFFARSFIRQYALALGITEKEIQEELDQQLGAVERMVPILEDTTTTDHGTPFARLKESTSGTAISIIGLVLVVLAGAGVYRLWDQRPAFSQADHPALVSQPTEPEVPDVVPDQTNVAPVSAEDQNAELSPTASAPQVSSDSPLATPAEENGSTAAGKPSAPVIAPGQPISVELNATNQAWVRVTADEKIIYTGTLEAGETRKFDAIGRLLVLTGNAGGLNIKLNGNFIGEVGSQGQVRTVEMTPDGFKITPPTKRPVAPPANGSPANGASYDPLG